MKRLDAVRSAALVLLVASAPAVRAQGFMIEGYGGYSDLSKASRSADAVFGSSGGGTFGGAVGYVFEKGFYVSAGARTFSKSGTRVFVADASSPAFSLGHPLTARLTPIYATIGYRFRIGDKPFVPYVGAGGGITKYSEESTIAGLTRTESETKAGAHVLAGVEIGKSRLRFAVEGQYATVPNTIGVGGISQVYGESNVGGFTALGKVVFALSR